jgi:hypothetical protein
MSDPKEPKDEFKSVLKTALLKVNEDGDPDVVEGETSSEILRSGMKEKFGAQFKCPACDKFLREPILTCFEGHNICSECREGVNNCPACKGNYPTPDVRNIALESMIRELELQVPCKHHRYATLN